MNQNVGIYRRCELAFIRSNLKKYQLLPLEGKMLMRLKDNCFTQEELVEYFNLDKGRMARGLASLEERNLIQRGVNERDRRKKLVTLTREGEELVQKLEEIFEQWDKICYQGFSEEEKRMHQEFVKRMTENVVHDRNQKGEDIDGK